jgi:preprotein translocase subunit SecE
VARDRQRAKQRKARRAGQNPGPAPSEPHRDLVPGELDHASGEADEFDAALVAGADGEPVDDDERAPAARGSAAADTDVDADAEPDFDEDEDLDEDEDEEERRGRGRGASAPAVAHGRAPAARGPARFMAFLRASWAELQRVQWPDRRQVFQATAVVLGFVIVAGVYLGVADRVAQEVVNLII